MNQQENIRDQCCNICHIIQNNGYLSENLKIKGRKKRRLTKQACHVLLPSMKWVVSTGIQALAGGQKSNAYSPPAIIYIYIYIYILSFYKKFSNV